MKKQHLNLWVFARGSPSYRFVCSKRKKCFIVVFRPLKAHQHFLKNVVFCSWSWWEIVQIICSPSNGCAGLCQSGCRHRHELVEGEVDRLEGGGLEDVPGEGTELVVALKIQRRHLNKYFFKKIVVGKRMFLATKSKFYSCFCKNEVYWVNLGYFDLLFLKTLSSSTIIIFFEWEIGCLTYQIYRPQSWQSGELGELENLDAVVRQVQHLR